MAGAITGILCEAIAGIYTTSIKVQIRSNFAYKIYKLYIICFIFMLLLRYYHVGDTSRVIEYIFEFVFSK